MPPEPPEPPDEPPELTVLARGLDEMLRRHPEMEEEIRECARDAYVRWGAQCLIELADGTWVGGVCSGSGEPVEVVPSACERIRAFDLLLRSGLGTNDVVREQEVIGAVGARLEEDIAQEFGVSLDELRAQCEGAGGT